jgi:hypothetical protein
VSVIALTDTPYIGRGHEEKNTNRTAQKPGTLQSPSTHIFSRNSSRDCLQKCAAGHKPDYLPFFSSLRKAFVAVRLSKLALILVRI